MLTIIFEWIVSGESLVSHTFTLTLDQLRQGDGSAYGKIHKLGATSRPGFNHPINVYGIVSM
jgi:hypothetical protein